MTVETDTIKNTKESPTKVKRKRASRSSSSGSSSSGTSSSSSASSRSSSSSSSNSSSSTSRSSSAASSPEKKNDRNAAKAATTTTSKSSNKKPVEHGSVDDKQNVISTNQSRRSPSPSSRRQEKEKEKEATKIYIGKLSLNVNKEHLAEIFATFGEIKEIDLPAHRFHSRLHRGFAHIEYVSPGGAEQACKYMDGGQVDGKEIVCVLVHSQPSHLSSDRSRREPSPYRRRRRSPLPPSRHYPPSRRMDDRNRDRDRDRGRYNDRRSGYSPQSRGYRRGQSPTTSSRRPGASGNTAESPKKKERRYSRSSSSESK